MKAFCTYKLIVGVKPRFSDFDLCAMFEDLVTIFEFGYMCVAVKLL
jgi:hypothetical protein